MHADVRDLPSRGAQGRVQPSPGGGPQHRRADPQAVVRRHPQHEVLARGHQRDAASVPACVRPFSCVSWPYCKALTGDCLVMYPVPSTTGTTLRRCIPV